MTDQQGPAAVFPTPPPFYKHFSKQNIAQLRHLRKEASIAHSSDSAAQEDRREIDVLLLSPELRYLVPPEPPRDGKYSSFGQEVDVHPKEPTLADSAIEQLYPSHPSVRLNPQPHMIALARSMLTTFLSLTGILSQNPELVEESTKDLKTIAYNLHYLINQYRPHQARETLILTMEERAEEMRGEIREIDAWTVKARSLLKDIQINGTAQDLQADQVENDAKGGQDVEVIARKSRQRAAWSALASEMG